MCGIIGYLGPQNCSDVIMDGLSRLEYRGYDSAGIAVVRPGEEFSIMRAEGKLKALEDKLKTSPIEGNLGMGHTRWATHGKPSENNAHPHRYGRVAVIHNGIIENYLDIKQELSSLGHEFESETDTEVAAHLIDRELKDGAADLAEAVRNAFKRISGSNALVVLDKENPGMIVGARKDSPLILGVGEEGEYFLGSDVPAFLRHTNRVVFLQNYDVAILSRNGWQVVDLEGEPQEREIKTISWSLAMAEKAGYTHFMEKEIFEQPRAITDTLAGRIKSGRPSVYLPDLNLSDEDLRGVKRIILLACGTSWHACLVGKFYMEMMAKIPTEVDLGSEFRYRQPLVGEGDLVIAVSQSGETTDTLAATREAIEKGARTVTICNVVGSTLTRETDGVVYTHAGPEIGVASTKAFTTQLSVLYMIALHMANLKGTVTEDEALKLVDDLVSVPGLIQKTLNADPAIKLAAEQYGNYHNMLYLGRGLCFPIALEGALKLKEISYIHAEGYAAGEMKHGPIALIDENMPVVVVANNGILLEKLLSNVQEVRARGGKIIAVLEEGNQSAAEMSDTMIEVPSCPGYISPIIMSVPLQMFSYHVAVYLGTDVDQPRNLAKSVTVE